MIGIGNILTAPSVRRQDLQSPVSSARSSPDPELEELLRARLQNEFAFTTAKDEATILEEAVISEDEVELRLFAASDNNTATTHKIRLSSPGAENGEPSLRVKKPRDYYFATEPTSDDLSALQAAAIDGKTVLELSRVPWPGCALPWKVRKISAAGITREVLVGHPATLVTVEEAVHKRTRKNKKMRIAIRKKREANKEIQAEKIKLAKEKEEADREKRTRRNREKKVKKKAKAQAKKEADEPAAPQADELMTE